MAPARPGTADVPIRDLFGFLFEDDLRAKLLAVVYRGYVDDSADQTRERVVVSAALIGDARTWSRLRGGLRRRLAEEGIDYFRSSECRGLQGQFLRFRDTEKYPCPTGREAADRVQADLHRITEASPVVGLGVVVPAAVFRELRSMPAYAHLVPPDPYDWAVQILWAECAKVMEEMGRNNVLTFAHDDGSNFDRLRALYREFKARNPGYARRLADFVSLDDKLHAPIQAADCAAAVTRRFAQAWVRNPDDATLGALKGSMRRVGVCTKDYAEAALKALT